MTTTGYDRKYAASLLAADAPPRQAEKGAVPAAHLGRPRCYPPALREKLIELWYLFDCLCGKRLAPLLRQTVPVLRELGECCIDDETAALLVCISAASIDRLLAEEKRRHNLRGSSITRPGAFLKRQIPIRTFAEWNDAVPGFVEADLVAHDGGSSCGDFLCSFTMTDVATGWTEPVVQLNRAQKWTFQSIQTARERLPFPLLGFDSDNGSEFVNRFFVEQKNNSVIRRCVGYPRYESPRALDVLSELYAQYRLLVNFFLPSAKLIVRTRDGSKVIRRHDAARTPCDRVLDHPAVSVADKERLRALKLTLNPAKIARSIAELQRTLVSVAAPINHVPNRWHLQGASHPHGKFSRLASS